MDVSLTNGRADRHRELPERADRMATADLRNAESRDFRAEIGACLWRASLMAGWSDLKELARELGRDERQVARWLNGQERVQVDVVFGCEALREPFAYQLAKLTGAPSTVQIVFRKVG